MWSTATGHGPGASLPGHHLEPDRWPYGVSLRSPVRVEPCYPRVVGATRRRSRKGYLMASTAFLRSSMSQWS